MDGKCFNCNEIIFPFYKYFIFHVFAEIAKDLKSKLDKLKKQTVSIHNDILKNNEELKKIKIDIDRNRQKNLFLKNISRIKRIYRKKINFFVLQEKIYLSPLQR